MKLKKRTIEIGELKVRHAMDNCSDMYLYTYRDADRKFIESCSIGVKWYNNGTAAIVKGINPYVETHQSSITQICLLAEAPTVEEVTPQYIREKLEIHYKNNYDSKGHHRPTVLKLKKKHETSRTF